MAGAVTRAYGYPGPTGPVVDESVSHAVDANLIWFDAGEPEVFLDCPPQVGARCVKVDVHRDTAFGNPLPTFFASLLGVDSQDVRATATAMVSVGNGTTCLKPWAIPDKWVELSIPPDTTFERYVDGGGGAEVPDPDNYVPPAEFTSGTGRRLDFDLGQPLILPFSGDPDTDPLVEGLLLPIVLDGSGSYAANIDGCNERLSTWGRSYPIDPTATLSATLLSASALLDADDDASWNATTQMIEDSCAPDCAPISPRLVPLALFDVRVFQLMRATDTWCPGGPCIQAVNLVGFFIEEVTGTELRGRLAQYPGLRSADYPPLVANSSFLPAITLLR
jgi:hypothetical protein